VFNFKGQMLVLLFIAKTFSNVSKLKGQQ